MVIAPDPAGWGSPFMAAVYMVKNNEIGKNIFRDWLKCYNPSKWLKLITGKWRYIGGGPWAGIDYEQGSFAKLIMPRFTRHLKTLPWYILHETNCESPNINCWSIHLPGHLRSLRPNCMVSEQTRRQLMRFSMTLFFTCISIVVLMLVVGLYFWLK
jgi:hypothetical protein